MFCILVAFLCRNARNQGRNRMLRLSVFGPGNDAFCMSLEPFHLACVCTLAFLKSIACPILDICAQLYELVSCTLTVELCYLILVSPT